MNNGLRTGYKKLILLLSILLFLPAANAGNQWRQFNIGNSDGLSNSAVNTIYHDARGYIWFGTWDGLNRYDGSRIRVYKPNVFEEGNISNNIIRNILEDRGENLWIITENGINRYNYHTETFTSYLTNTNTINYRENRFNAFLDSDSTLWCNVYDLGLYQYNAEKDTFYNPVKVPGSPGLFRQSVDIACDEGVFWTLSENGEVTGVSSSNRMKIIDSIRIPHHYNLDTDHTWFIQNHGEILLYIGLKNGGLISLNLESRQIRKHAAGERHFKVTSLSKSLEGTFLWGGTDDGQIFQLNISGNAVPGILTHKLRSFSDKQIKIWSVTETRPDLLWVGTDGDGVYKFIMENNFFSSLRKGSPGEGLLSHSIVRAIYEDQKGNLWIGTRGDGLNYIRGSGRETRIYDVQNGLSNNAVLALCEDNHHNMWIGIDGEGIDMLETNTGNILHFPGDFVNETNLSFGYVYAIVFDSFGELWLGTSGYGLLRLQIQKVSDGKYRVKSYKNYRSSLADKNGLQSNIIYAITEGEPTNMWIGTRGSGLYRLNTLTHEFESYRSNPGNLNSLNNNDILSLWKSDNQQLWIGTSGGLNRVDMTTNPFTFQHYTEHDGLPNNTIHSIMEDENGKIWISTNKGLARVDRVNNQVRSYLQSDGLLNNEYTDGASCHGQKSGLFYFGGVNGVDMFDPEKVHDSDYFPRLAITDFSLLRPGNENQGWLLEENIDLVDSLVLKYNQNFFKFNFTTLNYHNKSKCKYAFKLEGIDKEFMIEDRGDEATFTNIPPGKYLLQINWTNDNGVWHPVSRDMHLTILPPFWQTKWAFVLYGLLIIGLILAITMTLKRRIQTRHKITIDRMEFEKIQEMNQYKFQFFTNIAHEFRTPLTLIMAPAAQLMDLKREDAAIRPYLNSIYNNSSRLLHLIKELIDFRKVETGKSHLKVKHNSFTFFLKTITGAFESYARQKTIHLKTLTPAFEVYAWFDDHVMEKILMNLISNAIKYSDEEGEVIVKLEREDDYLKVAVKDTGKGIPEKYQHKIFDRFFEQTDNLPREKGRTDSSGVGLSLTKSLIEFHKGSIHLESIPGQGSCFTILFPFTKDYYSDKEMSTEMVIDETRIKERANEEFTGFDEISNFNGIDSPPEHAKKEKETVLIVDDNVQIRNLIADILTPDYLVLTAGEGAQGLELISKHEISVVVSDIIMPGMDGMVFCKKIKEDISTCHIPVILLTARGEPEDRIEGIDSGADSYIPKPFDPRHLKTRIKKLIENRHMIQQSFQSKNTNHAHAIKGLTDRDTLLMKKLQEFIEKNIDNEEMGSTDLAAELFISKTQLYRKVKALTGFTPHGFIKNIRLQRAGYLLVHTDMTVSEIIYETGFNNRTYFYRSFKEYYGITPLEYARKYHELPHGS